jgi:hypothetical protein
LFLKIAMDKEIMDENVLNLVLKWQFILGE